jgi:hypothetical protein
MEFAMGSVSDAFNEAYADGPESSPDRPNKPTIRTIGPTIEGYVAEREAAINTRTDEKVAEVASLATTATQWKDPVRVATTANINLAGGLVNGATVDSVTVATGDRVGVPAQTSGAQNGIYIVPASGAASRATDADTAAEVLGMAFYVHEGAVNGGKQFACTAVAPITIGTTALPFIAVSDQSALNANLSEAQSTATAGVNLSSVGLRGSAAVVGTTWTVDWAAGKGVFPAGVIDIAAVSGMAIANNETVYIDIAAGSSPYTPVKAASSPSLRDDFAKGRKLQLLYTQSGILLGPLVAYLVGNTRAAAALMAPLIGPLDGTSKIVGQVWTVSWTQFRGVWGGAVITVNDLAETTLSASECIYVDIAGSTSPYTAVKAATSATIRADVEAGKKVLLLHNNLGSLVGALAPTMRTFEVRDRSKWDQSEIVGRMMNNGELRIYQKGGDQSSNRYGYWRVSHIEVPDDAGTGGAAANMWANYGVFDHQRTDRETFALIRRLVATSSNDIAIRQSGKLDAMGGPAHGDEKLVATPAFLADGVERDMAPVAHTWYRARQFELIQKTQLFEVGTDPIASNPLATCWRRMVWKDADFYLHNILRWHAAVLLDYTYLSMMAIERFDFADAGFQITDTAYRSLGGELIIDADPWVREDVSTAGFTEKSTKADLIKLSGPNGYAIEMEALRGWDKPNRNVTVSNSSEYNKIYWDVTGPGYTTAVDEKMEFMTRCRIMNNN